MVADPHDEEMRQATYATLEGLGEETVRLRFPGYQGPMRRFASEWLAMRNQEARLRQEASQAEMAETASRAAVAAESQAATAKKALRIAIIANVIAAIAAAIAIAAIIVSVLHPG